MSLQRSSQEFQATGGNRERIRLGSRNAEERTKPLLRWVGGKQHIVAKLLRFLPSDFGDLTYREPFLGAGSLFFYTNPNTAILSDLNADLVRTYKSVATDAELIARYLRTHAKCDCENYYYKVRDAFNDSRYYTAAQAARFIYLNRTCFNGIYRVNEQGQFNVPYGKKESPILPTYKQLQAAGRALANVQLKTCDFEAALEKASYGDFVYLDPPYPALNGTSYFTHYTVDRFNTENQERLAAVVHQLDCRGCKILMTNADTELIGSLYRKFDQTSLGVPRYVTSKNTKHEVSELIITNY